MNENLIIEQENWRGTFTFRVVFVHLNFNQYDTNWKWKIYMWFSILDSFDYSPPVASAFWQKICLYAADTEKSARKRTTSGTLGIQDFTKYGQSYKLLIGIIK